MYAFRRSHDLRSLRITGVIINEQDDNEIVFELLSKAANVLLADNALNSAFS